jgi:site-specific recombinase XerD
MRDPANLAALLQSFFTTRLMTQRKVSPHTIASYRDTFRLLLQFAQKRLHKPPSQLGLDHLDTSLAGAFLEDLENRRRNGARSRNLRLTAIRSFFRYASLEAPAHSGLIQRVLAIPNQRQRRALVGFLTRPEIDALLGAPDRTKWLGRRDHAFLLTAVQTGLRLSEMTALQHEDVSLGAGAHVRCRGKGRKERCTPLAKPTVAVLKGWIREQGREDSKTLFPSTRGGPLSADGVQHLLARHVAKARKHCASLRKKRVSPHVLRHYLPFRTMSSSCSVAFLFGRFARNSGDIDIGLLSSAWGERADVELIIDNEAVLSRSGQKAHLRGSCNHNVTGRAADR